MAWNTFEKYLAFARAHDIEGLRTLSYKLSDICEDRARESECFALMDGVVFLAGTYRLSEFTHTLADSRQVILHTDSSENTRFLYFIRDEKGALKVLGVRFCADRPGDAEGCAEFNADTKDDDGDGWWNSVESLLR